VSGGLTQSRFESLTAVVLSVGVGLSAVLIGLGFGASLLVGWTGSLLGQPVPPSSTSDFSGLLQRLLVLQPLALAQLGLIVLIATPVFRVAITAAGFWRMRDLFYVALSLLVLALLLLSLGLLR
jgi:uncharacterized membrane protein